MRNSILIEPETTHAIIGAFYDALLLHFGPEQKFYRMVQSNK